MKLVWSITDDDSGFWVLTGNSYIAKNKPPPQNQEKRAFLREWGASSLGNFSRMEGTAQFSNKRNVWEFPHKVFLLILSLEDKNAHAQTFVSLKGNCTPICTQASGQTYVFGSLEYVARRGTAGHMIKLCFPFWGNAKIFSKVAVLPIHF